MAGLEVRRIEHEATWPLRHMVLRAGRPLSTCRWDGDELASTHHFGLFEGKELIGVSSIYQREHAVAQGPDAWQLRGMAVHPERHGQGLGSKMLVEVLATCRNELRGQRMWCNARLRAVSLYERHGFARVGEAFEIPQVGPHFVMWRGL